MRNGYHYLHGAFAGVDRERRTLRLEPVRLPIRITEVEGGALPYDSLVLSIGSRGNDFGNPGVA